MAGVLTLTAACLLSLSASAGGHGRFAYDSEISDDVLTARVVYKIDESGKFLSRHLRYRYIYDEQGRLKEKETLRWNELSESWQPYYCMVFNYSGEETCLEYRGWNEARNCYDRLAQRTVYRNVTERVVSIPQLGITECLVMHKPIAYAFFPCHKT